MRLAIRGILVTPNTGDNRTQLEKDPKILNSHFYDLAIGTYTKGMHARGIFLISSPEIRSIILANHLKEGQPVGSVSVDLNRLKQAKMIIYLPTQYEPIFQAKGVGDHLDLLLEKHFAKLFPNHLLHLTRDASQPRIQQWEKRGREKNKGYTFHDAWKQTRAKVIQNARKNRPPARRNH